MGGPKTKEVEAAAQAAQAAQQAQAPEKKVRFRRTRAVAGSIAAKVADVIKAKPSQIASGLPIEATKGLKEFCKKVAKKLNNLNDVQKIRVMHEVYQMINPARSHVMLSPDTTTSLFSVMAKLYEGKVPEILAKTEEKQLVEMRRFFIGLAQEYAKSNKKHPDDIVRVIKGFSGKLVEDDAMRITSLMVHSYDAPINHGVDLLEQSLGVKFTEREKAGFMLEMNGRGLNLLPQDNKTMNAGMKFYQKIAQLRRSRGIAVGAAMNREKAMRAAFNKVLKRLVANGEYNDINAAAAATLRNEDFMAAFVRTFAGTSASTKSETKQVALRDALKTLFEDMAEVEKRGFANTATQMEKVLTDTSKGGFQEKNSQIYQKAKNELQMLFEYLKKIARNKEVDQALKAYSPLLRMEAKALEKVAGGDIRLQPFIAHRLQNINWNGIVNAVKKTGRFVFTPFVLASELPRATEAAPGLRWRAVKEVKPTKRTIVWALVAGGAYYGINKYLSWRRDSLETAVAQKRGPLAKYLDNFSNEDLEFIRDNPKAYNYLNFLIYGNDIITLPQAEPDLDRVFSIKDGYVLNTEPSKIRGFMQVFRKTWMESENKGKDPEDAIGNMLERWAKPTIGYLKPSTKGEHMITQFAGFYRLDPKLEQFLLDNPDVFKMVFIGLAQGHVAASNVPGMLWDMQKDAKYVGMRATEFLDLRRSNATYGSIFPALEFLVGTRTARTKEGKAVMAKVEVQMGAGKAEVEVPKGIGKGYLYNYPIEPNSLLRVAEARGIWTKQKKKLNQLMSLFNSSPAARANLNKFQLPKDMSFFGDTIELAIKVAKGEIKDVAAAEAKGYIAHKRFADVGFKSTEAILYFRKRGLERWVNDNEKYIVNGEEIYKRFLLKKEKLIKGFSTVRLQNAIEENRQYLNQQGWMSPSPIDRKARPAAGFMVPMEPLSIPGGIVRPKPEAEQKKAGPAIVNQDEFSAAIPKALIQTKEIKGAIKKYYKNDAEKFSKDISDLFTDLILAAGDPRVLEANSGLSFKKDKLKITVILPQERSRSRAEKRKYLKFRQFVSAIGLKIIENKGGS